MISARRLFIALWPEPELRQQLQRCQQDLLRQERSLSTARRIPAQNLHLTLQFLGDVEAARIAALVSALQTLPVPNFELALGRLGYFAGPRILWLGLSRPAPALQSLVAAVRAAGHEIFPEHKSDTENFIAHISLSKAATAANQSQLDAAIIWQVRGFALIESRNDDAGVRYQVLHDFSQKS
jgi:2'-5' RNA ligase